MSSSYVLYQQNGTYYKETLPNGYRIYTKNIDEAMIFHRYIDAFNSRTAMDRVKEI